ncbi:hypothetical protein EDB19DRAFT_2034534 [Suillus lakei]|nr:hypothetical protein EDB19DRAFT_2034534 [Suillus lakei]
MKGFSSFVLVTIAFLQMTVAAPTVSERSADIDKRKQNLVAEGSPKTEDVEKRSYITFTYLVAEGAEDSEALDDTEA